MALIFGDSCDHYLTADILLKWTAESASPNNQVSASFAMPPHTVGLSVGSTSGQQGLTKALGTTLETFVVGFWWRTPTLANASQIVNFMDGGTEHTSVRYDTLGRLTFTRNGTVLATSVNTISPNVWYHIETKVTIGDAGDAPSGRYEVRVDGTATNWIADSGTGQDTRNGGNKSIDSIRLSSRSTSSSGTSAHQFQDVYVLSTTTAPNDFLGPCRFAVLRAVGVGTTAEWTGNYADNWQNVASVQGDSDSTFNQSSTAGQTDQFTMTAVPSGTVHAIQHVLMARKDAGAARTIRPVTRIGGTDYTGATVSLAANYVFYCERVNVSPATSVAWDDDEINAAEFGYELVT